MKFKHLAIGLLAVAPLALAHHSFAMFELTKDVAYEGTVMEYRWENPHTHIIVSAFCGVVADISLPPTASVVPPVITIAAATAAALTAAMSNAARKRGDHADGREAAHRMRNAWLDAAR